MSPAARFWGSYASFLPRIGASFFQEVIPVVQMASSVPRAALEFGDLVPLPPVLHAGSGAGALQQPPAVLCSSWDRSPLAPRTDPERASFACHRILAGLVAGGTVASMGTYLVSEHFKQSFDDLSAEGASTACQRIVVGMVAGGTVASMGTYLVSEHYKKSFEDLSAGFLDVGEVDGLLYCNEQHSNDKVISTNGSGSGGNGSSTPPPPPPGLTDEDKRLFLKLLLELQHHLRRLLGGEEYEELKVDLVKERLEKRQWHVLCVTDIQETRQRVEELLKEMRERNDQHVVVALLQKFAADLAGLLVAQKAAKPWMTRQLDVWFGEDATALLLGCIHYLHRAIDLVKGNVILFFVGSACISAKLTPQEAFHILVKHLKDEGAAQEVARVEIQAKEEQRKLMEAKAAPGPEQAPPA